MYTSAFYDEYVKLNAFLHSHSFTGNPLCCAVAAETLKIFADDNVLERNRALSDHMGALARPLGRASARRRSSAAGNDPCD